MKPSDKSVDLVEELKLLLNFTYELIELDDEDQDIFGSVRKIDVGDGKCNQYQVVTGIKNNQISGCTFEWDVQRYDWNAPKR